MVLWALENGLGGEIFVPKIPSYRILDVARAVGPHCEHRIVGLRPGEKIHEEMITESDALSTIDLGTYFAILPTSGELEINDYCLRLRGKLVSPSFAYNSGSNENFLSVQQIEAMIAEQIEVMDQALR
jgi:FlaA1/EpsC-like NDP-sugar epimerase